MPHRPLLLMLLGVLAVGTAQQAKADFRIVETVAAPGNGPVTPPEVPKKSARKSRFNSIIQIIGLTAQPVAKPQAGTVQGFGAAIPLAFACRQIVPEGISVVYANGVDTQAPVNWEGGRPWAAVLRDALAPAGLSGVPHGNTVEIRSRAIRE